MQSVLYNPKTLWNKVRNYIKPEIGTFPTKVILEDKTSPKKLAEIMNNHFINNAKEIQKGLKEERNDPI